jgi:hypothetical protein
VLAALGQLPRGVPTAGSVSRAHFLRLGAGAVIAAGFQLTGRVPASAALLTESRARSWVKANSGNLPQSYAEVTGYPMAYRRAIFEASSPRVRSSLWVEQFRTYLRTHPGLPKEKLEIVRRAIAIASQENVFADQVAVRGAHTAEVARLEQDAKRVFGREEAWSLIASLGPSPAPGGAALEDCGICECSSESDWCSSAQYCREIRCDLECDQDHGCHCFSLCGTLNHYECNGYCNRIS